ncbi:unnamed protein product [Closterium sp. Yama58-4]|nr:unnamed protein product [Closterium sp. Yama58-4]
MAARVAPYPETAGPALETSQKMTGPALETSQKTAGPAVQSPDTKPPHLQPKRAVESTETGVVKAGAATAGGAAADASLAARFAAARYMSGFGNQFESEALPGALPAGRNNPRVCPYGLYAEQLTGTAFTAPRKENQRSWLYRIKPSVTHQPFTPCPPHRSNPLLVSDFSSSSTASEATPNQLRWRAMPVPSLEVRQVDWVQGLVTVCGSGGAAEKTGFAIHMYAANSSMERCAFANADGDLLIVPQHGRLWITTEFGLLAVRPGEIAVLQQGVRFAVHLPDGPSRGYVCEVYGGRFQLPELGPIGANGLANPRDFQTPTSWFENGAAPAGSDAVENGGDGVMQSGGGGYLVVHKFAGRLFEARQDFSPFNVVAWHGNYVPYKYDLSRFCPMNAVAFDHPDPSIFTVLTCPTTRPGVAAVDFVLFPPRWAVAEGTFRPPYFHRNCMSEFMGLISGTYEAKAEGFELGGASLHSCMTPHGPDTATFERAVAEEGDSQPEQIHKGSLAFMLESCFTPRRGSFWVRSMSGWMFGSGLMDDVEDIRHSRHEPPRKRASKDFLPEPQREPEDYRLSSKLKDLFDREKFTDVVFEACDGTRIRAHRSIVAMWSPVLEALMEESEDEKNPEFRLTDMDGCTLRALLVFMYGGFDMLIDADALKERGVALLEAAHKYDVADLAEKLDRQLSTLHVEEQSLLRVLKAVDRVGAARTKQALMDHVVHIMDVNSSQKLVKEMIESSDIHDRRLATELVATVWPLYRNPLHVRPRVL